MSVPISAVLVGILFLASSGESLLGNETSGSVPPTSPTGPPSSADEGWSLAWTEEVALEELEAVMLRARDDHGLGTTMPPSALSAYAILNDDEKRTAWRMWLVGNTIAKEHIAPVGAPGWMHLLPSLDQEPAGAVGASSSGAGDMEEVWRIQTHGLPRTIIPTNDQGAYNLVTSYTILHFDGLSPVPTWLARPGEVIIDARGADANRDGVIDVVVRVIPLTRGGNSLIVLDGATGAVLHQFGAGEDQLYQWALTDIEKDGTMDVLGLDYTNRILASKIDGTPLFAVQLQELPELPPQSTPVASFFHYYYPSEGAAFADINGDEVSDIVLGSSFYASFFAFTAAGGAHKSVTVGQALAYDGRTGASLWNMPYSVGGEIVFPLGLRGGDFDGDGLEDSTFRFTSIDFPYAVTIPASVSITQTETGYAVFGGADGRILARDTRSSTFVFSPAPLPLPIPTLGTMPSIPQTMLDVDGDGTSELIVTVVAFTADGYGMDVVGIGPGAPGAPGLEEYRIPIRVEGDSFSARRIERDFDGDGRDDTAFLMTVTTTKDNKTSFDSRLFTIREATATETDLRDVFAFYDYDPVNQRAHGLIPSDDRWVELDADGARKGEGARILTQSLFLGAVDARNGTVPNLLLRKSTGAIVLDGTTGKIVREINRPLDTQAISLRQERGRDVMIERTFLGSVNGLDAKDGTVLFTAHPNQDVHERFLDAQDANGDGNLEVCFERGSSFSTDHGARVVDPRTAKTLWESDLPSRAFYYADVIADRPGYELLTVDRPSVPSPVVALFLPDNEKPLWNASLQGVTYSTHGDGFVVLRKTGADPHLSVLDGGTGQEARKIATPPGASLFFPRLLSFSKGTYAALVVSYAIFDFEAGRLSSHVSVEWLRGMSGNFSAFVGEQNLENGGILISALPTALDAGDWNADRKPDVAITANQTLMVVNSVNGQRIASAPGYLGVRANIDLEPDGKQEIAVAGAGAALVLLRHKVGAAPIQAPEPVVLQDKPQEALELLAAQESGKRAVPSLGIVGLLGVVAVVLGIARRRDP